MIPRNPLGVPISPTTLPGRGFTGISPKPENPWGPPGPLGDPGWVPYSPFVGPWPIAWVGGMAAGHLYDAQLPVQTPGSSRLRSR